MQGGNGNHCIEQDQTSSRYNSILQWLRTEIGLASHSHTPNREMLSRLKIWLVKLWH